MFIQTLKFTFCKNLVYLLVTSQILQYQSLAHGLFPLNIRAREPCEGHVRDNVYCAMCVWALSLAYG